MYPGILAFRIDSPVYYANVNTLEDKLDKAIVKGIAWSAIQGVSKLHYLIIDMTPVHHVDSMGLHFFEELVFRNKERGIQVGQDMRTIINLALILGPGGTSWGRESGV